ncbi:hypothetical protein FNL56_03215 [Tardiphaga sp. vice304]|uniref:hypothetical protein n=1 Tax=Tardiphaga sp. vice304 TaxID=2592817 RepID=UPI0011624EA8|nr:hypothetical protein [Tardiphaga sp. vice304]QDM25270.1 hypothetical protein FNL56_03215 [Tardiphaga sp. vice304]
MKPKKTVAELQKIIRQASRDIGPWPANMALLIYPLDNSWRIMVSYSDAAQTPFRNRLMELCSASIWMGSATIRMAI